MSLVNDALKKARLSQPAKLAPADGPALRPVAQVAKSGGVEFMVGGLIAGALLLAGMLIFLWSRGTVEVRARTAQASETVRAEAAAAAPVVAQSRPVVAAVPQPIATPVPARESAKSVAPAFKLQSVFFVPNHPSAIINGKTVRVGGVVNNARVVAIRQDSATIVTKAGETKVLELPND